MKQQQQQNVKPGPMMGQLVIKHDLLLVSFY